MKTFKLAILALFVAIAAFGQATTASTTLSAAVTANSTSQWCVASATGIVTPSLSGNTTGTYLVVDKEAVQVTSAGSSTTCFNVKRGQLGTSAAYAHSTSSKVWVGNVATGSGDTSRPFVGGVISANVPSGTCTASAQYSLPVILVGPNNATYSGGRADCVAGYWQVTPLAGTPVLPYTQFTTIAAPKSITTTSVSSVNGTIYWSSIYIPVGSTLTGACVLNGATVGTNLGIVGLYDDTGVLLASSALAGAVSANASVYQCRAFTATVTVPAGGYYVAYQANGNTDNFQAYAAGSATTGYGAGSQTGTFGTMAAITPAATFTADKGPLMITY